MEMFYSNQSNETRTLQEIDLKELIKAFEFLNIKEVGKILEIKILVASPYFNQIKIIRKYFKNVLIYACDINSWNLNQEFPFHGVHFDIIIVMNVLMYSKNPDVWINNLRLISRYLIIIDLIERKRDKSYPYLGKSDNDEMRFSFLSKSINSNIENSYDLSVYEPSIIYFKRYNSVKNEFYHLSDKFPIHFCCIMKGFVGNASKYIPFRFMFNALLIEYLSLIYKIIRRIGKFL